MLEKIKDKLKKKLKISKLEDMMPSTEEQKLYRYWMSSIERSKKAQPTEEWKKATDRYSANPPKEGIDGRPFVNDYRKLHESSMSFLDQQEPSFKITPTDTFMTDEVAIKQAECDSAYLKKVWREQSCQKVQSRKLNSTLQTNNGNSLVQFDVKKWMPSLKFLKSENVLFDSASGPLIEDGRWVGYFEDIPIEQFRSLHIDMPKKMFEMIVKNSGSVLTEKQLDDIGKSDITMYMTVRVYNIYARNSAAIRKVSENEEDVEVPEKRFAEELQLETPRRYMQFVAGWPGAVIDEDRWPFNLDHDEFPITHLGFNQSLDDLYGFTDYKQMERLDSLSDDMMRNLGLASFWASVSKFLGSSNKQVSTTEIEDFLSNPKTSFLADMLDPATQEPKIKVVQRGQIDSAQVQLYDLVHDQSKEASGQSELLENADIASAKDVTAIAARIIDTNMHQRINRRLGGPWGYEQSITEDATKMLEVAHQFVPRLSSVAIMKDMEVLDEFEMPILDEVSGQPITEPKEDLVDLPWQEALRAISEGGQLIKLGVDAIVGEELAQFWPYQQPPEHWRLSTKVTVEAGSTRSITKEQRAAVMKQMYVEVYQPFYESMERPDLAKEFLEMIGRLVSIPNMDGLLPSTDEVKQKMEEMKQQQQMEQQMAMQQPGATNG